jgi:hypothetical protein
MIKMGIYETIKDALNIIQKTDNIELYRSILDIQKECMDLVEENRSLKARIRKLEDEKINNDKLEVKGHCYYLKKDDGELDGPFCTTCWDKDRKLIRMHVSNGNGYDMASCHACDFGTAYVK